MYIYSIFGYGKCKTESSIGIAVRAIANNHKVLFAQFLKDGSSSEVSYLKEAEGVYVMTTNTKGIVLPGNKSNKDRDDVLDLYNRICIELNTGKYNLVVLDEILVALDMELLSITLFRRLISICRAMDVDMYMTGRVRNSGIRQFIKENSDCVTNAYCVKHMFDTHCSNCHNSYPYYFTYCPDCGKQLDVSRPCKEGRDY